MNRFCVASVLLAFLAVMGSKGHTEHHPEGEHRYAPLDSHDRAILEKTPRVTSPGTSETSDAATSSGGSTSSYAFTRSDGLDTSMKNAVDALVKRRPTGKVSVSKRRRAQAARTASNAADVNIPRLNLAPVAERNQNAGGTVLSFADHSIVVVENAPAPRLPWTGGAAEIVRALRSWTARPRGVPRVSMNRNSPLVLPAGGFAGGVAQTMTAPPAVKAIFVATGRSSGPAFRMTMVYDGPGSLELVDPGFVLEPVRNVTAAQAERELEKVRGRRVTATIDAYCLQMLKPPPAAGMVYRLATNRIQERNGHLGPIMVASQLLQEEGELHPDTDPVEYFHAIRQWSLWTHEQGFKDEAAFGKAFVEHAQKNLAAGGRRWTPALEQRVRGRVPNRWRDITEVIRLAMPEAAQVHR